MAGIENVNFGAGHVAPVGFGFFDLERRVKATPQHEQRRLVAAKPRLPCGIAGDVGLVVIEQVHLDVVLAWTAQERELVGPQVWVVPGYVRAGPQMPLAGGIEGQEVRPESRFIAPVSPEITTGLPERPQTVLVSDRVLEHQGIQPIGVGHRHGTRRAAVVLQKEAVLIDTQENREAFDDSSQVVEGVGERLGSGASL